MKRRNLKSEILKSEILKSLVLPRAPFAGFGMMRAQDEILFLTVRNHSFSLTQSADFWV